MSNEPIVIEGADGSVTIDFRARRFQQLDRAISSPTDELRALLGKVERQAREERAIALMREQQEIARKRYEAAKLNQWVWVADDPLLVRWSDVSDYATWTPQ